ncbi:MAG TPA: aminotransferase class IV [Bacteroidales bacterium]|nr:aminotransferase class IV [Bacteroidales bacterium]HRR93440.1 aminotransferase class IV [Bacteroidales bacterium]HRT89797.1 aminotransferase class IV [Bacteroidales bacterium]
MNISFFNNMYLPHSQVSISPDDRGFLFADGVYEVVRWYGGFFFDMEGHHARLRRSLHELKIKWDGEDLFPEIAEKLVRINDLGDKPALVYFQVTRGAAPRTHTFPSPPVPPTAYGFAKTFTPESAGRENGIKVMLKKEMRWARCDIKSVALLPNTMCFEEATAAGFGECIFIRDGYLTEGSHSNIFFVMDGTIYTHPESEAILSGITRKNAIRAASECGIPLEEKAIHVNDLPRITEAFITNTSAEITPVTAFNDMPAGNGRPGPVTLQLAGKFREIVNSYSRL